MKTDKELLILAAKACNLNVKYISLDADDNLNGLIVGEKNTKNKAKWAPLYDDGDALRLAVKLDMQLTVDLRCDETLVNHSDLPDMVIEEFKGLCPYAATRRAIVRAAAAIGEKL